MNHRWTGPLVTALILAGVALILLMNLNTGKSSRSGRSKGDQVKPPPQAQVKPSGGGLVEHAVGSPVLKNHMQISAVWLPSVEWDGPDVVSGTDLIHLEADVKATERNPNGFGLNEFVPYLKIHYKLEPAAGGKALAEGPMSPMVASDGLHYGASVPTPKPGEYRLTYEIQPPSAGGLGRHHDPISGVAPWWEPFTAVFDWEVEPPAASGAGADRR